jgi:hypothetical protein
MNQASHHVGRITAVETPTTHDKSSIAFLAKEPREHIDVIMGAIAPSLGLVADQDFVWIVGQDLFHSLCNFI